MSSETEKKVQEHEFKLITFKNLFIAALLLGITGLGVVTFMPFYPDLKPGEFHPTQPPELIGALHPNSDLNKAKLQNARLPGAESTVMVKGYLYTGLLNGTIVRIKGETEEIILDCDEEAKDITQCGRPLGMRVDPDNKLLYVADCVKGIYTVDLATKKIDMLFPALTYVGGKPSLLIDDLTVSRDGDIYFTDASTKWGFNQMHLDFAESTPNGRILHYDQKTKSTKILLDELHFPNGIQLEPGEESLLFGESSRYRILRYYLKGPNKGAVEIVAENLPGVPDNIRPSGRKTYWIPMVITRSRDKWSLIELLGPYPWIRQIFLRAPYLATLPFQIFDGLFSTNVAPIWIEVLDSLILSFGSGIGGKGLIVEIDSNGNIVRSLHSPDGTVHSISQVLEHKDTLYMGSPWENGLWKLNLNDITSKNQR